MSSQDPHDDSQMQRLRDELARLGEHEPSEDERALVASGDRFSMLDDVLVTAALIDWSVPVVGPALSEVERRRVWRKLAKAQPVVAASAPAESGGGSVRRSLLMALAVAAGLVLVPRWQHGPAKTVGEHDSVGALGDRARWGLEALGPSSPGSRARELAGSYGQKLTEATSPAGGEQP